MKIGIIGTRGIPNHYGGFEQFAEYLSIDLVKKGHSVFVYNSSQHHYQKKEYQGVSLIHKYDPEHKIGTAGQFIYDLKCILDSRKRNFDVILNLGYTSSAVWMRFFPRHSILITNMDGLEWKRSKYSKQVQRFLLKSEKWAALKSDFLIADSEAIQDYLSEKYKIQAKYIAYGAEPFEHPNLEEIKHFQLKEKAYNLLIARIEPENNIEIILDGIVLSKSKDPFLVIGDAANKFGKYLQDKYKTNAQIQFIGPIYKMKILNNLRYFSKYYFHGHSVGGTNPSLLEAMASQAFIIAHSNKFNKSILENNALYFSDAESVRQVLNSKTNFEKRASFTAPNFEKIKNKYSWEFINNQYETYFQFVGKEIDKSLIVVKNRGINK